MTAILPRDSRRSGFLLEWTARRALERAGAVTALSGHAGTFTRATIGTSIDQNGVIVNAAHSQPRFIWMDFDADGVRETPCLMIEPGHIEFVLQSENLGTTWAAVGTPTRSAAAHTASGVALDLIGDDAAGTLEGYSQTIGYTGNAVKGVSGFVKKGTSTSWAVRLRDTSASADRLLGVGTWSGSVPSVAMTTGTYHGMIALAGGVYQLFFAATSVTAANTNSLQIYPATTSGLAVGNTGDLYTSGWNSQNALITSSYLKTTTGSATRNTENFSLALSDVPKASTWYIRFVELGTFAFASGPKLLQLSDASGTSETLFITWTGSVYSLQHTAAAGTVQSDAGSAPTLGQVVELRGVLAADGSVTIYQTINGGSEVAGAASAANTFGTAWSGSNLYVASSPGGANPCQVAVQSVRVATGSQTLATMRGY